MLIHLVCKTEITLLIAKKVMILAKYLDFIDIFWKNLAAKLSKESNITKHLINLKPDKQLTYNLIYGLESMKLKTFNIIL